MSNKITPLADMEHNKSVLHELDTAKNSWFHLKAIVIAGAGFFTDAYDLFSISMVTKLLGRIYYFNPEHSKPGVLPINVNAAVSGVALCGTLAGQLFWGYLGDKYGRKSVYGYTLMLMIFAACMQAMSFGSGHKAVIGTLCFFRFMLGFGVGGDYPLSATIASEYASSRHRGKFIAAVFAMQGMGILTAATVAIITSKIFERQFGISPDYRTDKVASTPFEADYLWRVILMFGAFPAACTMYWRMLMPETARFTLNVQGNAALVAENFSGVLDKEVKAEDQVQVVSHIRKYTGREFLAKYWIPLMGCSMTWFLLDIAFYSQNLFQKDVFTVIKWLPSGSKMGAVEEVFRVGRAQAIIALCSTIPGYWMTVATVDIMGRWKIQMMGFFFMTLFMAILAGKYDHFYNSDKIGFIILYALTFFFANWGPNSTTFVIPAELFPTAWRSTAHGICAASGKAGAIIGAFGFLYASQDPDSKISDPYPSGIGLQKSLGILAAINFAGMLFTFAVPETMGKTLEELNDEVDPNAPAKPPQMKSMHFYSST